MLYYKLYFCETNAGYLTWAVSGDGRACYMLQDGHEVDYPANCEGWAEADNDERRDMAAEYLEALGDANDFDDLYANCEGVGSGFVGTADADGFFQDLQTGTELIAQVGVGEPWSAEEIALALRSSDEWIPELCARLVHLADIKQDGIEAEYQSAECGASILYRAAKILGVDIV